MAESGRMLVRGIGLCLALGIALACQDAAQAPTPSGGSMEAVQAETPLNEEPVVESVAFVPSRPNSGGALRAVVKAQDPDGDPLQLSYQWDIGGKRLLSEGPSVQLPELRKSDRVHLVVVASDGQNSSAPFSVSTRVANRPPRIVALEFEEADEEQGQLEGQWRAVPRALDPDGDRVRFRYEWSVNGEPVEADGDRFSKSGLRRGDVVRVRVHPSDGESEGVALESAAIHIGNSSPVIVSAPPDIDPSGVFHYALSVEDRDGDRSFVYRLVEAPEGMKLDLAGGELSSRPTVAQAGRHPVKLRVEDRHGGAATQSFEISVRVESSPASPR